MDQEQEEFLKYPTGKFVQAAQYSSADLKENLSTLLALADKLDDAIKGLNDTQLNTAYRVGGWTIRQVIHHLADSHLNAYIRTKWILTEDRPVIKAYNEKDWAITPENEEPPMLSISLIRALHLKWVNLIRKIPFEDLSRVLIHPAYNREMNLERMIQMYAWHSNHHLAHITNLRKRSGW